MAKTELHRATIGRLPSYLRFLRGLPADVTCISAAAIARGLSLGEVQVRKDLSAVCGAGKPRIGYERAELYACLESALDSAAGCEAVLVGAGRLGLALLDFGGFAEYGIRIPLAFDREPSGDPRVLPMESLSSYCRQHHVEIGIIAVPTEAAQQVADRLVGLSIRALWCFSPLRLRVPADVTVQYENLALSLAHLCQKVNRPSGKSAIGEEKRIRGEHPNRQAETADE